MKKVEICCDASIKKYPNGRTFGCAGAIVVDMDNMSRTRIIPDSTNNASELYAMYLAVNLAKELLIMNSSYDITIYADSKFVVYGMKVWMDKWLSTMDSNGVMYNYMNEPVKNQELFSMIINFMVNNNLRLKIRHQKGHVKILNSKSMSEANNVFYESNGYRLDYNTLSRISLYNNKIDKLTKNILTHTNPDDYAIEDKESVFRYLIPYNYKEFVL